LRLRLVADFEILGAVEALDLAVDAVLSLHGLSAEIFVSPANDNNLYPGTRTFKIYIYKDAQLKEINPWMARLPKTVFKDLTNIREFLIKITYKYIKDKDIHRVTSDIYKIRLERIKEGVRIILKHDKGIGRTNIYEMLEILENYLVIKARKTRCKNIKRVRVVEKW